MINRKIAMSGMSILTALTMMGGSAFAAFTTTATAQGNTFSTTNPSLTVAVNGGNPGTSVTGATVNGLIPGVPGAAQEFVLHNTDTDTGAVQALTLQLAPVSGDSLPGDDLTIDVACNGPVVSATYAEWVSSAHNLGNLNPTASVTCTMTPTLNASAPNSDAGKSAVFDAIFTGSVGS